jgi:hypothetical protein
MSYNPYATSNTEFRNSNAPYYVALHTGYPLVRFVLRAKLFIKATRQAYAELQALRAP